MTNVWYLEVMPIQEPYPLGLDDAGRAQIIFNAQAVKQETGTCDEEIVAILVGAGVGVFGTNIFAGPYVELPSGSGPYLVVTINPGPPPLRTHNKRGIKYQRPAIMITVRSNDYVAGRDMARAAYAALANVRNQAVTIT